MLAGEGLFIIPNFKSKGMECLPSEYWCPKHQCTKAGYKMAQEGNVSDPKNWFLYRMPDAVEKWGNKEVL